LKWSLSFAPWPCCCWRGRLAAGLILCLLAAAAALWAEPPEWIQFLKQDSGLTGAYFRPVDLPSGTTLAPRPPEEVRQQLTERINSAGADDGAAYLYSLRAREAERALDFEAAEADWKRFAERAGNRLEGLWALADFYHRRIEAEKEIEALLEIGNAATPEAEALLPAEEQSSWQAFERLLETVEAQAIGADEAASYYRAWLERYPEAESVYTRFFDFLISGERYEQAAELIEQYQRVFPGGRAWPVRAEADLARAQGRDADALAVYDENFEPLWPEALLNDYFSLLRESRRLRTFLDEARSAAAADPGGFEAAARVFHYYRKQNNLPAAQEALFRFRRHHEREAGEWAADELAALAELFRRANNHNEAARCYYALYSLPQAGGAEREPALVGLIDLLFSAPEQPIQFGSESLDFYRDVASMDGHPGFLNGILSLLFNSESPASELRAQERGAVAYFHRARAAQLLALLDERFPDSAARSSRHAQLIEAYAAYGEDEAVLQAGGRFLDEFTDSELRTRVWLLMADAYARTEQPEKEFEIYDSLLNELAARAQNVPLGEDAGAANRLRARSRRVRYGAARSARSPEYARVLDRYIARLVSLQREQDALGVYAEQIRRNPDDPGLYERLAGFLEQAGLGEQVEEVYRRAIERFSEPSWYHKLARWYLRQRRAAEFAELSRNVIDTFEGAELQEYFEQAVVSWGFDNQLYLQLNLYANERFPHNLTFVRNLLSAYSRRGTSDPAARERLLRRYWFYADDLRARFFRLLSRRDELDSETSLLWRSSFAVRAGRWASLVDDNPAAAEFVAEARIWRCHFEEAAPAMAALAEKFPAGGSLADRTASLHRSLAAFDPAHTEIAANAAEGLSRYRPRDREELARIGDIWADRGRYGRARPYWERMAAVEPGKPEGYLEAATVFWDYYLFDDALRLLDEARTQFAGPELFAYQRGAIHENRGDEERAVEAYLEGALAGEGSSQARSRLLQLARRDGWRERIDQATAALTAGAGPKPQAVSLRVAVLDAQQRTEEIERFLLRVAGDTDSLELLDRLPQLAAAHMTAAVRRRVIERQIELTGDPVERMRLRLLLMRLQESQGEFEAAREAVEALYGDHPEILGVIRGVVDFHWRQENRDRAISLLREAAGRAYPELGERFTFEAARKATEAGRYVLARSLLAPLLEESPFDAQYLAAMADTFAEEGDYKRLRGFYQETIEALKGADLPATQKRNQMASLRRGLIPALTKLGDPAAAVAQYIEIINRFPDDERLLQQAASYARRHGRRDQLIGYYVRTTEESPRDHRYHLVLARLHVHFEQAPEAIEAYTHAVEVRPDLTSALEARAALELRLLRFGDALATYQELYELTYENPRWMERIAGIHAREGRTEEAVAALKKARIENRPERPEKYFEAAARLEDWGVLEAAGKLAEKGVELAGDRLYRDFQNAGGAKTYARLMTRLRRAEEGFARLKQGWEASPRSRWRYRYASAAGEMAGAAARYFTPEEKSAFAGFLDEEARADAASFDDIFLPMAREAKLADLEARWLEERMMAAPCSDDADRYRQRLAELERLRLRNQELGQKLEAYWRACEPRNRSQTVMFEAAEAFRAAGDVEAEMRVWAELERIRWHGGERRERYLELLFEHDPGRIVEMAKPSQSSSDRADLPANYAVVRGDRELALQAVKARGEALPPIWSRAYTGLTGLYCADESAAIGEAFRAALGAQLIGEQLGAEVDREQALAGDLWFYYGARYGEHLARGGQGEAEDFLPASVEAAPARAQAYFELAEYYRGSGSSARAVEEYRRTLELAPGRAAAHSRLADLLWEQGSADEALSHWRSALEAFRKQVVERNFGAAFWEDAASTLRSLGAKEQLAAVEEQVDQLLRTYVRYNGAYRTGPLFKALAAAEGAEQAAGRAIALASESSHARNYLREILEAGWFPESQRGRALLEAIAAAESRVAEARGRAEFYERQELDRWRIRWVEFLLETGQAERAQEAMEALPKELLPPDNWEHLPLIFWSAAQNGRLDALLDSYRTQEAPAPPMRLVRDAANRLRDEGAETAARAVLDYYYTQSIALQTDPAAGNSRLGSLALAPPFLGLAELRLEQQRPDEAAALLWRMTRIAGEPFEQHVAAARLLSRFGRPAEAVEFLSERVRAKPWDHEARLMLAAAQKEADVPPERVREQLAGVASHPGAPYETRAEAARLLPEAGGETQLGSDELNLLATASEPEATAVRQPHFFFARLRAAEAGGNAAERLPWLRGALEILPEADPPRLRLFRSAREAGEHRLAVAAIEPLLSSTQLAHHLGRYDSRLAEHLERVRADDWLAGQFLNRQGLEAAERARFAAEFAGSLERTDRLLAARVVYKIALHLAGEETAPDEAAEGLRRVEARLERRMENARRRPVITEHMDQDRPVRPRLALQQGASQQGGTP